MSRQMVYDWFITLALNLRACSKSINYGQVTNQQRRSDCSNCPQIRPNRQRLAVDFAYSAEPLALMIESKAPR